MSIHTVFSMSQSPYQIWQAQLLAYSHWKVGQPGPLTALVSTDDPPQPVLDRTFYTRAWSPHPRTGDAYLPYNKPYSIMTWLAEAPPEEETVLLIDPDCVFLEPVEIHAVRGRPIAHHRESIRSKAYAEALRPYYNRPDLLQPMCVPVLIHRDDLAALAPRWLAVTEALREDPASRAELGWVAEMWAYIIAAAQIGLWHELRPLESFVSDCELGTPFIHYAHHLKSPDGKWSWHKGTYRPWDPVEDPPPGTPEAGVTLIRMLNRFAAVKRTLIRATETAPIGSPLV